MTNNNPEIPGIISYLESTLHKQIKECDVKYLTKPGDNYGSIMYDLTITFVDSINNNGADATDDDSNSNSTTIDATNNKENNKLKLVAKTPVINPELIKVFQPELSCVKENGMYQTVYPILKQLQMDANVPENEIINVFPKCYGARLSIASPTANKIDLKKADNNAILLLENLRFNNDYYQSGNRSEGFDSNFTYQILENLAKFHALPIAVRKLKSDVFNTEILPLLFKFAYYEFFDFNRLNEQIKNHFKKIELDADLQTVLYQTFVDCEMYIRYNKELDDQLNEFSTIAHCDFWVNNLMYSKVNDDDDNEKIRVKIFDFQLITLKSLAIDIAFFLFTSVKPDDLEKNFDNFLRHYYESFCKNLKQVGCSIENISYCSFINEFYKYAKMEFSHIILMMRVLMAKVNDDLDMETIDDDQMFDEKQFTPEYFERIKRICLMYRKFHIL